MCRECGPVDGGAYLSPEALAFLRAASTLSPERLGEVALTSRAARELTVAHRLMISSHLEKELKSVRVLREMSVASQLASVSANDG